MGATLIHPQLGHQLARGVDSMSVSKDVTNPHKTGKNTGDGKIHKDTNLTRKTDCKTGYKHGQFNNHKKGMK